MGIRINGGLKPTGKIKLSAPLEILNLTGTGDTGRNIALITVNGFTNSAATASATYHLDVPASAFDGHGISVGKLNSSAEEEAIQRGIWLSPSGQVTDQWLAFDFGGIVEINAIRLMLEHTAYVDRKPKNLDIQYSEDGISYNTHESFLSTENLLTEQFSFSSSLYTRYFRMYMHDNWGNTTYLQVSELEILKPA